MIINILANIKEHVESYLEIYKPTYDYNIKNFFHGPVFVDIDKVKIITADKIHEDLYSLIVLFTDDTKFTSSQIIKNEHVNLLNFIISKNLEAYRKQEFIETWSKLED